jgi:hypothetical protein
MTDSANPQKRPRTWAEMRDLVIEQDYFDVTELERRKRRAHQMKYAIWLMPLVIVLLIQEAIGGHGPSWVVLVAIALITYGSISSYRLGVRWERRWDELIRAKSAQRD